VRHVARNEIVMKRIAVSGLSSAVPEPVAAGAGLPAAPFGVRGLQRIARLAAALLRRIGYTIGPMQPDSGWRGRLDPRRIERPGGAMLSPARLQLARRRLAGFVPFDAEVYQQINSDVRADANGHALLHGWREGRSMFRPQRLAPILAGVQPREAATTGAALVEATAATVGIGCSRSGNVFMAEIADDLAAALVAAGARVVRFDETSNPNDRPRRSVIVAPHEFFVVGQGPAWRHDAIIANAVMLNTEQAQTSWFATALPFLFAARGVIDLSAQMQALFEQCGLPSLHLQLGAPAHPPALSATERQHRLIRVLPPAAQAKPDPATPPHERPVQVAFFGAVTQHREDILARHAAFLAEHRCFIYCRRAQRPINTASEEALLERIARHVGGHAAITLNLHRDSLGYFEWHRIVRLGMAVGSVVVSEPCLRHPIFRPGVHYFEETGRHMPNLIAWLLHSEDGRRAAQLVQENARRVLAERCDAAKTGADVLAFLARVA
jgi:hypothetical protein